MNISGSRPPQNRHLPSTPARTSSREQRRLGMQSRSGTFEEVMNTVSAGVLEKCPYYPEDGALRRSPDPRIRPTVVC